MLEKSLLGARAKIQEAGQRGTNGQNELYYEDISSRVVCFYWHCCSCYTPEELSETSSPNLWYNYFSQLVVGKQRKTKIGPTKFVDSTRQLCQFLFWHLLWLHFPHGFTPIVHAPTSSTSRFPRQMKIRPGDVHFHLVPIVSVLHLRGSRI